MSLGGTNSKERNNFKVKIVVCVKQNADGELNPFDACAYEEALRINGAEVALLSMAPKRSAQLLTSLTRLGAKNAYLLCDKAFAGADTLATSYTLSRAIKKLSPDLIFCGRQTLDGDIAQVGPGLAEFLKIESICSVMKITSLENDKISAVNRQNEEKTVSFPALLTFERINDLRLPSIRSKVGSLTVWGASDIGADISLCGQSGSPTKVIKTFESSSDRRRCKFITPDMLAEIIEKGISDYKNRVQTRTFSENKLKNVWTVGEKPRKYAESISDDIRVIEMSDAETIASLAKKENPSVILWDSSPQSKEISARVAVILKTGLCADCTSLETDGEKLYMYRPAFSGNVIAKIICRTNPQMATVRTEDEKSADVMISFGKGAFSALDSVSKYAEKIGAELAASRGAVDMGAAKYQMQIGLTGRAVSPPVYIAVGISGAVHHIVGMKNSGTVVAVNTDKNAPIFGYADYGIVGDAKEIFDKLNKLN